MRNPFRRRHRAPVMILDMETFDPNDLLNLKPGPLIYYNEADGSITDAPLSLADMIETAGWWTRLTEPSLFRAAADRIRALHTTIAEKQEKIDKANAELRVARTMSKEAKEAAKDLVARAGLVISEMSMHKGTRDETPAAIVVSPWQLAQMTYHGYLHPFREKKRDDLPALHTLHGIPVYSAKGVYGPVVMTEDGFAAFSRNAPELMLKAA